MNDFLDIIMSDHGGLVCLANKSNHLSFEKRWMNIYCVAYLEESRLEIGYNSQEPEPKTRKATAFE